MQSTAPVDAARMYERYFVPAMFAPWSAVLARHAGPVPGERVLDVACGTGVVARAMAPLVAPGGQVVALDINPAMLEVARASSEGLPISWRHGPAAPLPVADGSFDLVTCQHGLQFFPDRVGAVREMRRALAPRGRAVVVVLQGLTLHPVFEALMTSVAKHLGLPLTAVAMPFALADREDLLALFVAAGFTRADAFAESITARFADPSRFVPLAIMSSAAAIPAFAGLDLEHQSALVNAVRDDVEPVISEYRDDNTLGFPMFAHVVCASA